MDIQNTITTVKHSALIPSPTNPRKRFNDDHVNGIAETMKTVGVLQALVVRKYPGKAGKYEIVAGETRWRAAKVAGLEELPVNVRELSDAEVIKIQIIENLQRDGLHPMEEAEGFKALLDRSQDLVGYTIEDLSRDVGKPKRTIYASMQLCNLCDEAKKVFLDGDFPASTALMIARLPETLQKRAIKDLSRAPDVQMSVREAKAMFQHRYTLDLTEAKFDINDADLLPNCGSCMTCPKRSGTDPETFPDIESADVCTDPDCFADKKKAHVAILIASSARVIQGEDADKIAPMGVDTYISSASGYTDGRYTYVDGHDVLKVLGDDLPEPYLIVDKNNNYRSIYSEAELKKLAEKKIESGEYVPPEVAKTESQIEREKQNAVREAESTRRTELVKSIFGHLASNPIDIRIVLRAFIESMRSNWAFNINLAIGTHGCDSDNRSEFFDQAVLLNEAQEQIDVILRLLLSRTTEVSWNWQSDADNKEDQRYQPLVELMKAIGFDENAADKESATAEEKQLPPKLQAIKDQELAKRARRSASQAAKTVDTVQESEVV